MGITFDLGIRRRRALRGTRVHVAATTSQESASAELENVMAAARLVVSTRFASATLLMSRLDVSADEAARILARLEHCEVIAPAAGRDVQSVLTTPAQLPGLIREFARRG